MPTTSTPKSTGEVLATLALTTSEDTYTLRGASPAGRVVQLVSDAAWHYSHKAGGPYFPVGANVPLSLDILTANGDQVLYVKTQSGTGTLFALIAG